MKLHDRALDLFASLNQQQPGRFELVTPVRKIALDLSGGQVLGIDGVPELLTDLTELRGLQLSGHLAQDLNVALTQGVSYETAAHAAADNLGRLLIHLLGQPHGETRFIQAPPSPGAWPLPKSLVHILRDALREERDPEALAKRYEALMEHSVERAEVNSEPFALDPVALRTLGAVRSGVSLGELLLHSGRGVPQRTHQALLAIDLLSHLGLLALRSPDEAPHEDAPVDAEGGAKKPRLKKRRRRRKKRPAPEVVEEYEDLDLSVLDEAPPKVIPPEVAGAEQVAHVVESVRTPEQELWYGVNDLTPDEEDEDDPFGLFVSSSHDGVIEPDPQDLTGEFIWADDRHSVDAWAVRVAEKTVSVPEVSLKDLQHLPMRFRTMNPLEVLGLEPGDTVSVATVRESYEQRFAQFDPEAWRASGDEARSWAAQARAYVSAAYRKVQTVEGIERYAARWREEQRTAPLALDEVFDDEDTEDLDVVDLDPA